MSRTLGDGASGVPSPKDERISSAELQVWLDWLGLRQRDAAHVLHVREDTVRRWLSGREPVPVRVGEELEAFDALTADAVGRVVDALQDARDPAVAIYRRDEDMPDGVGPVRSVTWWRMVVARATVEVPGVEIAWADEAGSPRA